MASSDPSGQRAPALARHAHALGARLARPPPPLCPTLHPPVRITGTFKLTLEFTEEYPNKAPVVKFKSQMFHPNSASFPLSGGDGRKDSGATAACAPAPKAAMPDAASRGALVELKQPGSPLPAGRHEPGRHAPPPPPPQPRCPASRRRARPCPGPPSPVYADGGICLDILQNQWSPIYDVSAILTSIQVRAAPQPGLTGHSAAAQPVSRRPLAACWSG
jgi:hypothetical protein